MGEPTAPPGESLGRESDPLIGRVISVVAATLKIEPARITAESSFQELGSDSLDALNILFALEEEFNITIPDNAALGITTVSQLVEALRPFVPDGRPGASQGSGS